MRLTPVSLEVAPLAALLLEASSRQLVRAEALLPGQRSLMAEELWLADRGTQLLEVLWPAAQAAPHMPQETDPATSGLREDS